MEVEAFSHPIKNLITVIIHDLLIEKSDPPNSILEEIRNKISNSVTEAYLKENMASIIANIDTHKIGELIIDKLTNQITNLLTPTISIEEKKE